MSEERIAGRYEVRRVLGKGGMGVVLQAYDHTLEINVAIKKLHLIAGDEIEAAELRALLLREARILARLNHPSIVRLFNLQDSPDGLYIVMEYVSGPSLQQVLRARKRLNEEELCHVMHDVCPGLDAAHAQAVIHRDLKPGNLLVVLSGDEREAYERCGEIPSSVLQSRVKITDFGISKVIENLASQMSQTVSGTPAYMAPEQFMGEVPSPETDVYALGVMTFEMIGGQHPFRSGPPMYNHLMVTPETLTGCSPAISAAVRKAMSKARSARYPSASAYLAALRQAPGLAVDAIGPHPGGPVSRRAQAEPTVPDVPPSGGTTSAQPAQNNGTLRQAVGITPRRNWLWAAATGCAALLVAGYFAYRLAGPSGGPSGDEPAAPTDAPLLRAAGLPTLAPLPLPPFIDRIPEPPVQPFAQPRAPVDSAQLEGPARPDASWMTRVHARKIVGLDQAGTVYLYDFSNVEAVRESGALWGYSELRGAQELRLDPRGIVWLLGSDIYAFNQKGEGGRLRRVQSGRWATPLPTWGDKQPGRERERYVCIDGSEADGPAVAAWANGKRAWTARLDYDCAYPGFQAEPGGNVVVKTKARTLYSFDATGKARWKSRLECDTRQFAVFASGDAAYTCGDNTYGQGELFWISGGERRWRISTGGHIDFGLPEPGHPEPTPPHWSVNVVPDRRGVVYFPVDSTTSREGGRVLGVDRDGKTVFQLPLGVWRPRQVVLAANKRLLVLGQHDTGSLLVAIGR